MHRGTALSISLLKAASAAETGEALAKGLKHLVRGAADVGGGVAKGFGVHEGVGKALGVAALGGGAALGAQKVKNKVNQYRYGYY